MNKIKKFFRDTFFKVVDEETFDKDVFIKSLKVGGIALVVGLTVGAVANSGSSEIKKLEKESEEWETKFNNATENAHERSEKTRLQELEIAELKEKVDSAKPWFEMEEAEQEAEAKRIAEEKAQKEAEAQAQKEEEERIAQEEKIAKEKADKEAEAQKYHTGITYEDLARNPNDNIGKLVRFQGKVLQVISGDDSTQYRMAIDSNYNKVVLISVSKSELKEGNLLENDVVTIEGKFLMETEYKTVRGDKRNIPLIIVDNLLR